jgi:hypothetical protein
MQEDEDRTLSLAARDLEEIRRICEASGGRVLKSTGDGLLIYFDSAVEAVASAVQAQNRLAARAEELPPPDRLQHRVGIHLGDVFLSEGDVMGDGVNIAARLQSEAPPGGICISQTVYDVVKNRLQLQVTPLGPKELKNIKEAVPVYQVLLEAVRQESKPAPARKKTPLAWQIGAAGGGALLVAVVLVALWAMGFLGGGEEETGRVAGTDTAVQAPQQRVPTAPPPQEAAGPAPTSVRRPIQQPDQFRPGEQTSPRKPPGGAQEPRPEALSDEQLNEARQRYLSSKDISGMVAWLSEKGLVQMRLGQEYQRLEGLDAEARKRLRSAGEGNPLTVSDPWGKSSQLWSEGSEVVVRKNGVTRRSSYEELPMELYVTLIASVASSPDQMRSVRFLGLECARAGLVGQPRR